MKSSVEQIRQRFDNDVERFANLETGQTATMDAALCLELVAQAAARVTPHATHLLDVGCGAGNYTLKVLHALPNLDVTLVDLSEPMLKRAVARIQPQTTGRVRAIQSDIRALTLEPASLDIVLAAAVLHHLRSDEEWRNVFAKFYAALRPGGSIWIFDLIESSIPALQPLFSQRYGEYLTALRGDSYREQVFAYIEEEDTPRSLIFQLDCLRAAGFAPSRCCTKTPASPPLVRSSRHRLSRGSPLPACPD